ncbi:Mur ligase [Pterulicium gracile]|uniref:Mur ligase n=1 Tax=Pterulicium gracile TaxID=1884261 RepID=A0A5C3QIV4_9AGAR|nr:Mur ligase [Pterula gracilis]
MSATVRLGLERISTLASHLPKFTRPTCHIAGTNGKGSVAAILSSILLESSLSVGRYNSPHLVEVHDCIAVNGESISYDAYKKARDVVEEADRKHTCGASSFELLTMTALIAFEQARVDIVVLEVGMGGRLDATNCIPDPVVLVSALTSVDLDHQRFLGSTTAAITREKAAIARNQVPFVLGAQKHSDVGLVARETVEKLGGIFLNAPRVHHHHRDNESSLDVSALLSGEGGATPSQSIRFSILPFPQAIEAALPLPGDHQLDNMGIAAGIISSLLTSPRPGLPFDLASKITPTSVATGIQKTRWPGRLSFHAIRSLSLEETLPKMVLADGAHNRASANTLSAYVHQLLCNLPADSHINLTYLLALSHSPPKTPIDTLTPLLAAPHPSHIRVHVRVACLPFSPPAGMPWVTPVPPADLARCVEQLAPNMRQSDVYLPGSEDPRSSLHDALRWAHRQGTSGSGQQCFDLVVVAGSLYLVADFYRLLAEEGLEDGLRGTKG